MAIQEATKKPQSAKERKTSRKQQILQALAQMLEESPGQRITTAGLAKQVGVSEAALYRHFPSKAKMFEALIEFAEESIFSRVNKLKEGQIPVAQQCHQLFSLVLGFAHHNPGISRVLSGDALVGETERLRKRVSQFFDRLESQLKQFLKEAEIKEGLRLQQTPSASANLLLVVIEGAIHQYVRSEFARSPTACAEQQFQILKDALLSQKSNAALEF